MEENFNLSAYFTSADFILLISVIASVLLLLIVIVCCVFGLRLARENKAFDNHLSEQFGMEYQIYKEGNSALQPVISKIGNFSRDPGEKKKPTRFGSFVKSCLLNTWYIFRYRSLLHDLILLEIYKIRCSTGYRYFSAFREKDQNREKMIEQHTAKLVGNICRNLVHKRYFVSGSATRE